MTFIPILLLRQEKQAIHELFNESLMENKLPHEQQQSIF